MSVDGWNTVLVLGGIRSGKSEFAEALVVDAPSVRYVATAAAAPDDPEWAERIAHHQRRRKTTWTTEETGDDPARLVTLITEAKPDETLLVDDLGGWVTAAFSGSWSQTAPGGATSRQDPADLAAAVRACEARLVIVSPEVGLSVVPATEAGRAFADALGVTNQAVAQACDAVVLVVAGQATWLKPSAAEVVAVAASAAQPDAAAEPGVAAEPAAGPGVAERDPAGPAPAAAAPEPAPAVVTPTVPAPSTFGGNAVTAPSPTTPLPVIATGLVIQPGMSLPMPDEDAAAEATARLPRLDLAGAGLGELARVVTFAAGTQGQAVPRVWRSPRLLLLHGSHAGGAAAGQDAEDVRRRVELAREGAGPLGVLAAQAGASMQVVDAPAARAMELEPALDDDEVEHALRYGWRLAEEAVDAGVDVVVIGACGVGTDAAAAAVIASTAGAEVAAVLPRAIVPGGRIDDAAWMARCSAVRDAVHRIRDSPRGAREVLAEVGGGDVAVATGVLLGATARRTPVLLDGPIGVAAALVSRDLAGQARHWCLLPDHGGNPAVTLAADVLGLTPYTELRLDLGEGATSLAALPLLCAALTLAATLPATPPEEADDVPGDASDDTEDTPPRE